MKLRKNDVFDIEIVDINTLEKTDDASKGILAAMAVYIGKTRLIDNFIID